MKEYKNNQELIDYLISKNVIINDVQSTLKNIEKYTYYSIVNGYKSVFKDEEKYQEFELLLNKEIEQLKNKLTTIDINDILRIMGYNV